jgi:hypothetical protein
MNPKESLEASSSGAVTRTPAAPQTSSMPARTSDIGIV